MLLVCTTLTKVKIWILRAKMNPVSHCADNEHRHSDVSIHLTIAAKISYTQPRIVSRSNPQTFNHGDLQRSQVYRSASRHHIKEQPLNLKTTS